MPQTGNVALGDEEAKAKPADFLVTDLQQRIEAGTAKFVARPLVALGGGQPRRSPRRFDQHLVPIEQPAQDLDPARVERP